jgi:hypothetical protein
MKNHLKISVCTYNDGQFDVMIRDGDTGEELILSGNQKVDEESFELISKLAPACVWTSYESKE